MANVEILDFHRVLNIYDNSRLKEKGLEEALHRGEPLAINTLTEDFKSGKAKVYACSGAVSHLEREKPLVWVYTANNEPPVKAALQLTGLDKYVGRIITTDNLGYRFKKDAFSYGQIIKEARTAGHKVTAIADDGLENTLQALYASVQEKSANKSSSIKVYLVKRDATGEQLGKTKYGFYVVNDLDGIGKVEHRKSRYRVADDEQLSDIEKKALENEWHARVGKKEEEEHAETSEKKCAAESKDKPEQEVDKAA